ncbi:hypothetical protein M1L60_38615 [Actinoplanes sp. TRM 88003]|uniref:Uncharacterized protein n=1 Tax=Paractinoplanes aksuensis TaxID=2939490 RepID=A0ABT1E081_9ACTN|nr:hypothetical protein [Actinoplanes aksuensis]MCO8276507.1 hypothetical protein [Actinoplanes aksuensis]
MGGRGGPGRALPPQGGDQPGAAPPPAMPEKAAEPKQGTDRIRDVYTELAEATGGGPKGRWIDLADLREQLADLPRAEVDQALRELIDDDRVRLEPEPHRHRLGDRERDAAIRIGGEDRHKIWIEPDRP